MSPAARAVAVPPVPSLPPSTPPRRPLLLPDKPPMSTAEVESRFGYMTPPTSPHTSSCREHCSLPSVFESDESDYPPLGLVAVPENLSLSALDSPPLTARRASTVVLGLRPLRLRVAPRRASAPSGMMSDDDAEIGRPVLPLAPSPILRPLSPLFPPLDCSPAVLTGENQLALLTFFSRRPPTSHRPGHKRFGDDTTKSDQRSVPPSAHQRDHALRAITTQWCTVYQLRRPFIYCIRVPIEGTRVEITRPKLESLLAYFVGLRRRYEAYEQACMQLSQGGVAIPFAGRISDAYEEASTNVVTMETLVLSLATLEAENSATLVLLRLQEIAEQNKWLTVHLAEEVPAWIEEIKLGLRALHRQQRWG